MSNFAARFSAPSVDPLISGGATGPVVSAADEQAFLLASARLTAALAQAADGQAHEDITRARKRLRELAVKLRDAGYWRSDKQGLRATVSLLWQADRHVNDIALHVDDAD